MPTMSQPLIEQFLVPFIVRFFFAFGIIGFAVGVGLILNHVRMHQLFVVMDRWVSMRRSTKWLAVTHDIGPSVQRFPRLIGTIFILLAAFSTFVLLWQLDVNKVVDALRVEAPNSFVVWIVDCVRWFLVAGSMLAIAVGTMLILWPNALRSIEARASRWYSFRSHTRSGDTMHMGFDLWIERYPKVVGWIIAMAALVVVVDYGMRLFARG
jgi:hypothetical protein